MANNKAVMLMLQLGSKCYHSCPSMTLIENVNLIAKHSYVLK